MAVTCEFSTDDHGRAVYELLGQYGFRMVLQNVFESYKIGENALNRLKRDLDRVTDSFDLVRLYQYPLNGTLAITILKDKKWRRFKIMAPDRGSMS